MKISKIFSKKQEQNAEVHNNPGIVPDTEIQEVKVTTKPNQKRQRHKKVRKICIVCLEPFTASRSDAMTCSGACRQNASYNGINHYNEMNTAEHSLIFELEYRFNNLLDIEGKTVNKNELLSWIAQSDTAKRLTFPYISSNNYYARLYVEVLEGFYYHLLKPVKANNWSSFTFPIPENWRQEMLEFIESTKELHKAEVEPEVIYMN